VARAIEQALAACARGEPNALLELALTYEANGLDALALAGYELCLAHPELCPRAGAAELQFHRGRALTGLMRAEEAAAAFEASLALASDSVPARWRLGQLWFDAGRLAEARAQFEQALALAPLDVPARLGLARLQLVEDDPRGAIATLEPVARRQPDERFVHGLLARAWRALGDEARAAAELALDAGALHVTLSDPLTAEMRTRVTGAMPAMRRASRALEGGEPEEAARLLAPIAEDDPGHLAVAELYAHALVEARRFEPALAFLARSIPLAPGSQKLELLAARALEGLERPDEALQHLLRARAIQPGFPQTHAMLGALYARLGRLEEAEEALRKGLAAPDAELASFLALGQLQLRRSAWERAAATFARASERFPSALAAWTGLAEARLGQGERELAREALARAEEIAPAHARVQAVRRLLADEGGEER
jgi:tetratricopeptide (TPR) repeat protein